jgi:hypothetical protein
VRKGGISANIYKRDGGGKRVASLKYAFRLILVAGNYNKKIYILYFIIFINFLVFRTISIVPRRSCDLCHMTSLPACRT